jgi:hypothetical protein
VFDLTGTDILIFSVVAGLILVIGLALWLAERRH